MMEWREREKEIHGISDSRRRLDIIREVIRKYRLNVKVKVTQEGGYLLTVNMQVPFQKTHERKLHSSHFFNRPNISGSTDKMLGRQVIIIAVLAC